MSNVLKTAYVYLKIKKNLHIYVNLHIFIHILWKIQIYVKYIYFTNIYIYVCIYIYIYIYIYICINSSLFLVVAGGTGNYMVLVTPPWYCLLSFPSRLRTEVVEECLPLFVSPRNLLYKCGWVFVS